MDDDEVAMETNGMKSEYEVILPVLDASGDMIDNSIHFVLKLESRPAEEHIEFFSSVLVYCQEAARMLPAGDTLFKPQRYSRLKDVSRDQASVLWPLLVFIASTC
jgi:hypothetical protein